MPGKKRVRGFNAGHKGELPFGRASTQEAVRYNSRNGETLITHGGPLEDISQRWGFDARRIHDMDDAGMTPGKDVAGTTTTKRTRALTSLDSTRASFYPCRPINTDGIHLCGWKRRHEYVCVKGTALRTRTIKKNGEYFTETISNCLQCHSIFSVRPDVAACEKTNFLEWATHLV